MNGFRFIFGMCGTFACATALLTGSTVGMRDWPFELVSLVSALLALGCAGFITLWISEL